MLTTKASVLLLNSLARVLGDVNRVGPEALDYLAEWPLRETLGGTIRQVQLAEDDGEFLGVLGIIESNPVKSMILERAKKSPLDREDCEVIEAAIVDESARRRGKAELLDRSVYC